MTKVKANHISINFEERGSGEPLILIMGLGASGAKWEPHTREYEKAFRCIIIDNRGAGLSDKPGEPAYSTEDMAKDVIGVMNALDIQSAHIHGISMGGAIAQKIAAGYPERVRSLILTSTFSRSSVSFSKAIEILKDSIGVLDSITFGRLLQWMIYSFSYQERFPNKLLEEEKLDMENPNSMPVEAFRAQCYACMTHDSFAELPMISAPTLVAAGVRDLFVSREMTMELVDNIPNAKLYWGDGGHVHHWESIEAFNKITMGFLMQHMIGS